MENLKSIEGTPLYNGAGNGYGSHQDLVVADTIEGFENFLSNYGETALTDLVHNAQLVSLVGNAADIAASTFGHHSHPFI